MRKQREYLHYILPAMLAFALSGVYAIADGFFVGNELGDNALAAINIAYPITAFIQAVGTGIGMGGAIRFSVIANSTNPKQKYLYFGSTILLLILSAILMSITFWFVSPPLLRLFGGSGQIYALGKEYLRIISIGALFQVLGTGLVPFIRNMGGSVTAMAAMISGFISNIVLDWLMVWVLPYGMTGAATATIIGQAATFLVCLGFFILKKEKPVFSLKKNTLSVFGKILLLGLSPFGLTFSPNITLILVNKSAFIYGGDSAVACYAVVAYFSCVVLLLLQGVSDGYQPIVSKAIGQGNEDKAKDARNFALCIAALTATLAALFLFLAGNTAGKLFGSSDEVAKATENTLPIFISGFVFAAFSRIITAYFYASEKTFQAYLLIYCEPCFLLLFLLILPQFAGLTGTWFSVPASQLSAMLVSLIILMLNRSKLKKTSIKEKQEIFPAME